MKHTVAVALLSTVVSIVAAAPVSSTTSTGITSLPTSASATSAADPGSTAVSYVQVAAPGSGALAPAPVSIDSSTKQFLDAWQASSGAAAQIVSAENATQPQVPASGQCYAEYPCNSVGNVATAQIGTGSSMTQDQMNTLLTTLTSQPSIKFDASNTASILNGMKVDSNGITLEAYAKPGSIDSKILAGMVFDMYKAQSPASGDSSTTSNAVRATMANPVANQDSGLPQAICVYPSNADAKQAQYFCTGLNLDGTMGRSAIGNTKRNLGKDIKDGICDILDLFFSAC